MEQLKLRVRNGICICFTAQGKETATRLLEKLSQQMEEAFDFLDYTGSEHSKPLKQVVKEAFQEEGSNFVCRGGGDCSPFDCAVGAG